MKKLGKWWSGLRCLCRECGERFQLEDNDKPETGFLAHAPYYCCIRCPTCGEWVNVDKPWNA